MIDISKIKRGDKVTLVPLEVERVLNPEGTVRVKLDKNFSHYFTPDQIAAHHPAPREIGVGDRVKVTPPNPSLLAGTVEHVARRRARVLWDDGDDAIYAFSDLTIVEDDQ